MCRIQREADLYNKKFGAKSSTKKVVDISVHRIETFQRAESQIVTSASSRDNGQPKHISCEISYYVIYKEDLLRVFER